MSRWYHGTSMNSRRSILASWFRPAKGIWGRGIYLSSSKQGASLFGSAILSVQVEDEGIGSIAYEAWVQRHPSPAKWPDEVKKLNLKAIQVCYHLDHEKELCVFDPNIIKQIFY